MSIASAIFTSVLQAFADFFRVISVVTMRGAWVVYLLVFFAMLFRLYMNVIRQKFIDNIQWVFIRVRVPEGNLRTPRSMEELMNVFHGLHKTPDLLEFYLDGYVQSWISLEMRGTSEGVTHVIRLPRTSFDAMQAAIYAQYPDAEIDEVADYTTSYTVERLNKDFKLWGTEMILEKDDAYPIKTYVDFEDQFAEEGRLVDPMAAMTEIVGVLKPGEEIWVQVLLRPAIESKWRDAGMALALGLAGREVPKKPTKIQKAFELLARALVVAVTLSPAPGAEEKKEGLNLGVLRLTPGETDIVRAIQRNISKPAFESKIRAIYIGPPAGYNHRAKIPGIFGMFRQFASFNTNAFKPDGRTNTSKPTYGFTDIRKRLRQRSILWKYRKRFFREKGYILNVEEAASVYHFPVEYVKTPTLERARAKKGEAPTNVPLAPEELPLA